MGSEVGLPPACMFDGASIRTVPYIERGGTFYMGRLNMSNMECGCMCSLHSGCLCCKWGEGREGSLASFYGIRSDMNVFG